MGTRQTFEIFPPREYASLEPSGEKTADRMPTPVSHGQRLPDRGFRPRPRLAATSPCSRRGSRRRTSCVRPDQVGLHTFVNPSVSGTALPPDASIVQRRVTSGCRHRPPDRRTDPIGTDAEIPAPRRLVHGKRNAGRRQRVEADVNDDVALAVIGCTKSLVPSAAHCGALQLALPISRAGTEPSERCRPVQTRGRRPIRRRDRRRTRCRGRRRPTRPAIVRRTVFRQVHRLAASELSDPDVVVADQPEGRPCD